MIIAMILTGIALLDPGPYGGWLGRPGPGPSVRGTGVPSAPTARGGGDGSASDDLAARRWEHELRRLDRLRARAWRRGDPGGLGRVYVPRSRVLALDRRHLRAYVERGYTVRGVRLRILGLRVVDSRPTRVRLDVVDRLLDAVATDPAGEQRVLPSDRPHRHTVDLRRVRGRWRIAAVGLPSR